MSAGIRPTGVFPYAALRYNTPEARKMIPCFGKNAKLVPDPELCETCAHLGDCRKEFYGDDAP